MNQNIAIKQTSEYKVDKTIRKMASRYLVLTTIRRDLRTAHIIVSRNLKNQKKFNENAPDLENYMLDAELERSALMHTVILYGRWFTTTKGKLTLKPKDFFEPESKYLSAHYKVMELRNHDIAHNEKDILGGDTVNVTFDSKGKAIEIGSTWLINMFLSHEELNLDEFKTCIEIVHNKIDDELLPSIQQKLLDRFNS